MLSWRVMGIKLFWSRDRLVKHEIDCLGLGLRTRVGVVVGVMDSFGVMGRVRVGIRVIPVCSAACKTIKTKVTCYSVKLRDRALASTLVLLLVLVKLKGIKQNFWILSFSAYHFVTERNAYVSMCYWLCLWLCLNNI